MSPKTARWQASSFGICLSHSNVNIHFFVDAQKQTYQHVSVKAASVASRYSRRHSVTCLDEFARLCPFDWDPELLIEEVFHSIKWFPWPYDQTSNDRYFILYLEAWQ